jgi:ABC-type Fe3+-hydroxamate transport system substrate-binding protein
MFISNDPIQVFGKNNYQTEMLEKLGFRNLASSLANPYPIITDEFLYQNTPEWIICTDALNTKKLLDKKFGNTKLKVNQIKFVEIDENTLTRSGPNFLALAVIMLREYRM